MSRKDVSPEDLLPLSPPVFNILLALGNRPLHGYAIIQEFERKTGHVGALLPGSLYNTIARMLKSGFIEEVDERPPAEEDDDRRRYYQVTALGERVASAESERLWQLLTVARDEDYLTDPV